MSKPKKIELAGGLYAERTKDKTYVVKQGDNVYLSGYTRIGTMPDGASFFLVREDNKIDLLFRDGTWITGALDVVIIQGNAKGPWAAAVITDRGITLTSPITDKTIHFDYYPFISVYKDAVIFVYDNITPGPYVRAFSFCLELITEGTQEEVENYFADYDI